MKRNHSWRGRLWILACVGSVAGCGGSSPPPETPEATSAADAAKTRDEAAPSEELQSAHESWDGEGDDGAESGAYNAPAKAQGPRPAGPPPAMAPAPASEAERSVEHPAEDADDRKAKKSAKGDTLAGTGSAASFDDVPSAWTALVSAEAKLGEAVELQARDCDSAETYRRAVCDLAGRICSLEDGLPSSGSERRCGDSRARCSAASARYRHVCEP